MFSGWGVIVVLVSYDVSTLVVYVGVLMTWWTLEWNACLASRLNVSEQERGRMNVLMGVYVGILFMSAGVSWSLEFYFNNLGYSCVFVLALISLAVLLLSWSWRSYWRLESRMQKELHRSSGKESKTLILFKHYLIIQTIIAVPAVSYQIWTANKLISYLSSPLAPVDYDLKYSCMLNDYCFPHSVIFDIFLFLVIVAAFVFAWRSWDDVEKEIQRKTFVADPQSMTYYRFV